MTETTSRPYTRYHFCEDAAKRYASTDGTATKTTNRVDPEILDRCLTPNLFEFQKILDACANTSSKPLYFDAGIKHEKGAPLVNPLGVCIYENTAKFFPQPASGAKKTR